MGVDLQGVDAASIDRPDLKRDLVTYVPAADLPVGHFTHRDARDIRGPPPDWPGFHETYPSLILTTQRVRI